MERMKYYKLFPYIINQKEFMEKRLEEKKKEKPKYCHDICYDKIISGGEHVEIERVSEPIYGEQDTGMFTAILVTFYKLSVEEWLELMEEYEREGLIQE